MRLKMRDILGTALTLAVLAIEIPVSANAASTESLGIHEEAIHDAIPTAFAPTTISDSDFLLEWDSAPITGISFAIEKKSLQWSRVSELIVIPRARVSIDAVDISSGQLNYGDFSQPILPLPSSNPAPGRSATRWNALISIALISGPENAVEIKLMRQNKLLSGRIRVRFQPKSSSQIQKIVLDPSCSKFKVSIDSRNPSTDEWLYIGCRLVVEKAETHKSSLLELYVYWDNVGQLIEVGSIPTHSVNPSLWKIRTDARQSQILLTTEKNGGHELRINYHIPETFHAASLGLGVGPYGTSFVDSNLNTTSELSPVLTLYGSYVFSEGVRAVAFDATTINSKPFTDLGLYFSFENSRFLDRRVIFNFLVGGHAIVFQNLGLSVFKFGAPQGVELTFLDFLKPGMNAMTGAFIYPSISGTQYYNAWLRYGNSIFAEINYIDWQVPVQNSTVSSRSLGVSVGFPIASFL